ncbi:MAG: hypothetical protein Fur007_16740 [Rhodoferax sp.]
MVMATRPALPRDAAAKPAGLPLGARWRLGVACLAALATSLPMAWVSLAKTLVLLTALIGLGARALRGTPTAAGSPSNWQRGLGELWTPRVLTVALLALAASSLYSDAPVEVMALAWVKHAKLLLILVMIFLLQRILEMRWALWFFCGGQIFFVLLAWAMVAGWTPPWASAHAGGLAASHHAVYSTYLDQSIILASAAAVLWHLRAQLGWARPLAMGAALLALADVLWVLQGRSGYAVALVLLALALAWALPPRWRWPAALALPVVMLTMLLTTSTTLGGRVLQVWTEARGYLSTQGTASHAAGTQAPAPVSVQSPALTSSGFRLHAWRRSLQAMQQAPWLGHGLGAWTLAVKHIEGPGADAVFGPGASSNPHQEFLLWGVTLGWPGVALLLGLGVALVRDARRFEPATARALISVTVAAGVAGLFNSALYDALVGDFFCVTLGLLLALGLRQRETQDQP